MPKTAKNGKKTGDNTTKKESTGLADKTRSDDALSECGKEFYRAQIRDLEEQLEKYQHKCDKLEVEQKDFSSLYDTLEEEKKQIVHYLKRSLTQEEEKVKEVTERLVSLQQAKDAERDAFEMQLAQIRLESQENKDKLTSKNMVLASKLAALEDFRVQKEELTAHMQSLEMQLEKREEEHRIVIYNLERKAVLDIDRLKKEMQQRVAAVAAEFRRESDRKMPEITKRAIHENVSVNTQISQLSDRSRMLLEENETLRQTERDLRREMGILESVVNDITHKNVSNQKVVQLLTAKCGQMNSELMEYAKVQQEHQQLQEDHTALLAEMKVLRQEQRSVLEVSSRRGAEAESLAGRLEQERAMREQLETILHEAAFALKDALMEVPKEEDSEVKTLVRRNQMMQKLLAVLDGAARLGRGPAMKDFIPEGEALHKLKTGPNLERTEHLGPLFKTPVMLSHFKTGYLGLVPCRTHYKTILSKMGPASKNTCPQLHRTPQKKTSPSKPSGPEILSPQPADPARGVLPSSHSQSRVGLSPNIGNATAQGSTSR
ncbi:cilia- and flagella-associated protein 157 [Osmerus eperlanus]|uniref:cilia- and flagella-associated protein 157 n=1 Tax=Osmerus eperlanus TaxID=29151 RepID=UPI002E1326A5